MLLKMLSGLLKRGPAGGARADERETELDQLQRAARDNPRDPVARSNLCSALNVLGRYEEARREGEQARRLAPGLAAAHHNFGLALLGLGRAEEAERALRRARQLAPALAQVSSALGHALRDQGRFDDALAAYDAALRIDPEFGDAIINRAQLLLLRGDYARGWQAHEQRFEALGAASRAQEGVTPWRGESLAGRTILVHGEQGVGDEVMYASCIPDLAAKAGQVLFQCSDRLAPLFARSFEGVQVRAAGAARRRGGPRPDLQVDIGSLPRFLRACAEDFPTRASWLVPDPGRVERWRGRLSGLGGRARVGISWRGGAPATRGPLRSVPLDELEPLLRLDGVEFVSLQHPVPGAPEDEQDRIDALGVHQFDATEDLDELAALICALDLVVSVDNSNVHLAGALGQDAWVLLPRSPDWRYGWSGEMMPWYASLRLWRKAPREGWPDVIRRVADELSARDFAAASKSRP
jgi:tetratricopeptide (TPR) repeat protein